MVKIQLPKFKFFWKSSHQESERKSLQKEILVESFLKLIESFPSKLSMGD